MSNSEDKYILKIENKLRVITSKKIDNMNFNELLLLAMAAANEQQKQLLLDARSGKSKFFHGKNVVEALELSLNKITEKIPDLRDQLNLLNGRKQRN